jgi:SAM-dependent methyltransferase
MSKQKACVEPLQCVPLRKADLDRFRQGKRKYYEIAKAENTAAPFCLDIACGHKPFPKADVLCDLNVKPVPDRSMHQLVTDGKPFVLCSCYQLPFKDQAFEFVTSYYLIEHINSPQALYRELRRVSKHGYIQAPSWISELMYGEAVHKWIILKRNGELYLKPTQNQTSTRLWPGFVFHKLYGLTGWQIFHAMLDETLHLFTVSYSF